MHVNETHAAAPPSRHPGVQERAATQFAGFDLDPSRRPGVPKLHDPAPLPNSRFPPQRQHGDATASAEAQGRPGRATPPVFGTAVPRRGLSGLLRAAAYRKPDHDMSRWTTLLLADRVDAWEHRLGRLLPLAVAGAALWAGASALRRTPRRRGLRRAWAR